MDLFLIDFEKNTDKFKNKKLQSNISKILAEKVLKSFYNKDAILSHKKDGFPYFINENKINISISHSENMIALLFAKSVCGVDVEYMKERNYGKILKYFKITCPNITKELFYQLWCDFEARYKSKLNKTESFIFKDYMCSFSNLENEECNVYKATFLDNEFSKPIKISIKPLKQIGFGIKNSN